MTEWKDIKGFEGLYKISSNGYVKSLGKGKSTDPRTKQVRIIKPREKKNGYLEVKLHKDGRRYFFTIHRLVANAFLLNPCNKPEVNHKNGIKKDNNYLNLEWCTPSENQKHAYENGLQKRLLGVNSPFRKSVNQLNLNGELIKKWHCIKDIQRDTNMNTFGIIKCCKNEKKYKTAYGFKWEYSEKS